ncbi:PaaX family transcriptional regulator C-terminal domain-containing protein [Actinomadura flavalba]|uniref:PaaX family transcriptional regulator n=1 Tax=Actinomadura flavalba TaxID=1120938 RepID=UPI00037F92BB|nr:PaaX family transcriptional regulator C-terminal domain-containing protein [Actinomadura flavalba]
MNARSALFDLYGDHLRRRGGSAPISALVALLGALGIAPPAVRQAASRMVRQGWLERADGYRLTPRATHRLDEAARRIYRDLEPWDGYWDVLVLRRVRDRARRDRLAAGLTYLGYARLEETTWIGPRASTEVTGLLAAEAVHADRFRSALDGDPRALVRRVWNLDALANAYTRWLDAVSAPDGLADVGADGNTTGLIPASAPPPNRHPGARRADDIPTDASPATTTDSEASPNGPAGVAAAKEDTGGGASASLHPGWVRTDEQAFATRTRLVHEWRKFLFEDPGLPAELLPEGWPGSAAARRFDAEAARLLPGTARFVDRCLRAAERKDDDV